jgi:hypothetical protein
MRRAIGAIIRGRGPTVEATDPLAGFDVPVVRNGEIGCKHHQQLAGAAPLLYRLDSSVLGTAIRPT